jgi:hypothetical protein
MATSTAKASPAPAAFYAGLPYLIWLALACEESEDFLLSDAFLEATDAEEALWQHLEFDAALADKYGLRDADEIWRAFAARDIGPHPFKTPPYRGRMVPSQ